MPVRATKRGAERTPLGGDYDVVVCGASFAGLAVARELRGSGARVLVVDRYEIGERQTSACAAPTEWLEAMGIRDAIRQELPCMTFHTPHGSARFRLPWSWSSFDYRTLCRELWVQCGEARFEIAKVQGVRAQDLKRNGIVDRVIPEYPDAAYEPEAFCERVAATLENEILGLLERPPRDRLTTRLDRYRRLGSPE